MTGITSQVNWPPHRPKEKQGELALEAIILLAAKFLPGQPVHVQRLVRTTRQRMASHFTSNLFNYKYSITLKAPKAKCGLTAEIMINLGLSSTST